MVSGRGSRLGAAFALVAFVLFACADDLVTTTLVEDGRPCPPGTKTCEGRCVDVLDPLYGCAPELCAPCASAHASLVACRAEGACRVVACEGFFADCDGAPGDGCEADLRDPTSCGACGVVCQGAESCSRSGCGGCPEGELSCDRRCVDPRTDVANCGACGRACASGPNGVAECRSGTCAVRCSEGFADCDGVPDNGCEPLLPYYVDGDRDGWGKKLGGFACAPPPAFVGRRGDCDDGEVDVHAEQPAFFATGYRTPEGITFDYDCDGAERVEPVGGVPPPLGSCGPGSCTPGYAPAPRTAPAGSNPWCGSAAKYTCALATGSCATTPAPVLRCH